MVHFDARNEASEVPAHLADNPSLTLKLSYAFQGETVYDDEEITAYLKFNGDYFKCVIPWDSIWGLTAEDGNQVIWAEDLPKELMLQIVRQQFSSIGKKLFDKKGKKENLSDAEEQEELETPVETAPSPKPKKSKGHLKLIK